MSEGENQRRAVDGCVKKVEDFAIGDGDGGTSIIGRPDHRYGPHALAPSSAQ
jgi:hypothetical protein